MQALDVALHLYKIRDYLRINVRGLRREALDVALHLARVAEEVGGAVSGAING